ncbi:MAG TPA: hypothetical protein PKL84_03520, partial [Candidatus Hydrogenedentes bacterium]|nr:hypothetical protein [Candidatus Hydrogenedentota bacterium]
REPFRLDVIDTTAGPMFVNDEITLFPGGTEGAGEWPGGAVYSVVDTETGKNIGAVVVGLENRTITTIYSIKAKTERTGMGSRVLRALTASNPQPIVIDNIMAPAKEFWDKAGIYDYDGINAKLDWQSLNDARRKASDLPGSVRQDDGKSDLSGDEGSPGRVEEKKAGYGVEARAQNSFVDAARARIEPWLDELRFQAQDKFHFLNKVQRAAAEEKGLAELPEREDAYLAELRYHGMAGAAIEDFQRTHVDPVLAAIKESGLPIPEIDTFLHARHAPEANAQLKKINPDRANNEALSGMSNEEAAAVMEGFRKAGKLPLLNEIGEWVDAITAMRRDLLVKSGLETQSLVNRWASTYKHYVPLHREGKGGALPRKGKGFDTRGKEKRRAGSTLAVEHVLAHVIAQHEATILRAEKAKVGRALLEFARANPDPDLFEVDKVEYRPSFDSEGLVTFRADPGFVMADNVLVVRENGVDHRITFNAANPYALKIAAAMKNLGAADAGAIVNILTKFTRYLAIVNTSANPEFLISNFARDIQTAGYNLSGTKADALKWKIFRDVGRAWAGIRAFQKGEKTPWAERFDEFRKAGAQTGWLEQYKDISDREKALVQKIRDMGDDRLHAVKRGLDAVWKFIEHHNTAVENSIRLSTFVHAREAGMTEAQAARLAKELTVNFNRKGSMGQTLNALYLFFNAAVQGSVRIFQALATSQKVRKLAIGTIIGAALLDIWNRAQGDDDEPNPYDAEVMKHTKERNVVVMLGDGKYLKIPAPWGFNVLHVMGQTIGEALTKPNFKPTEAASRLAVATLNAFNPVGGSGSLLQMVSPTITDPFAQWGENEDWAGRPLRPDGNPFGVDKPESQKYWASVRPYSKWVAEQLNELTGGDEVRPGMIDISPEAIDLTIDTLTGGAGRFLADTLGAPWKAVRGDDVETYEVPVLRKIYGAPGMGQVTQDYYKNRDSVALLEAQLKHYASDRQKFDEVKSEYAAEYRVLPAMKMAEKHLRMLRKQKKAAADDPKRVKDVDAQMKRVMEKFNRTYSQAHR